MTITSTLPLITHAHADDVLAYRAGLAISAAQFLADARQLAAVLPAGGHVLNACVDRYRFAVGLAAALLAGKISVLPPSLTPEMVSQVQRFAPDVFCLTDHPQSLALPHFLWRAEPAQVEGYAVPHIPTDRTAAVMFTSGSTGTPVAQAKRWGALAHNGRIEAARLGLLDGRHHCIVATVPPQHMYGFECTIMMVLQGGAALSAEQPFYPADICAALQAAARPCTLVTTPVHLKVLLACGLALPTLDLVVSATAPLSTQLAQATEAGLRAPLLEIYGSTESGSIASRRTTQSPAWTLFPELLLQAGPDRAWVAGAHLEQATALGDQLELLSDGRFLLHGRSADLINIAGKRNSLGYLNHQLNAISGVQDAAFYLPDDSDPDQVVRLMAFAVAPGMTASALLQALRLRIDANFMPRPLVMLDALPRNVTGKLPRAALAALAREHLHKGAPHAD